MTFRMLVICAVLLLPYRVVAQEADLRLAVPAEMIENGFTRHILPRFGFKTQVRVAPVVSGEPADMVFGYGSGGSPVFERLDGGAFFLRPLTDDAELLEKIDAFADWLRSDPGQAAITGFAVDGAQIYGFGMVEVTQAAEPQLDGDIALGSKLALLHCGRCHVVDQRNRMGGIGSTPSFSALRGRVGWSNLFLAFWAENPHPSFTQVKDVTEPFDAARPSHIAPVEVTLEEIDAITAFVGTLTPKDLGAQVSPR